jgi:hypothetical protein
MSNRSSNPDDTRYWDYTQGPLPQDVQDARARRINAKYAWRDEVDRAWTWGVIAVVACLTLGTTVAVLLGYGPVR